MADSGLKQLMDKMAAAKRAQMMHTGSYTYTDPRIQEYMDTNERLHPELGLEAPLFDPLDPFMLPKTLPVKAAKAYAKLAAEAVERGMQRGHPAFAAIAPLNIVKHKGGNWLDDGVEKTLAFLKGDTSLPSARSLWGPGAEKFSAWTPEEIQRFIQSTPPDTLSREAIRAQRNNALNRFVEGPLTRYVKRDMATESDPVRKLAEQGILHYQPAEGLDKFFN